MMSWEARVLALVVAYLCYYNMRPSIDLSHSLRALPYDLIHRLPTTNETTAYVQYATQMDYFQAAVNNCIDLRVGNTRADALVILYTDNVAKHEDFSTLTNAVTQWNITLKHVPLLTARCASTTWCESFTKLHVFNQSDYDVVVYMDADLMVMPPPGQSWLTDKALNLDELFNLPKEVDLALPRAYWIGQTPTEADQQIETDQIGTSSSPPEVWSGLPVIRDTPRKLANDKDFFASHVMVIRPRHHYLPQLLDYVYNPWWWHLGNRRRLRRSGDYDMEIINRWVDDSLRQAAVRVAILPHQNYGVLTGLMRERWHQHFLTAPEGGPLGVEWNVSHVRLVHFLDAPLGKPWEEPPQNCETRLGSPLQEAWCCAWARFHVRPRT